MPSSVTDPHRQCTGVGGDRRLSEDLGELVLGVGCFGEHPPGEYAGEGLLGLISLGATGSGGACSESATGVQSVVIHLDERDPAALISARMGEFVVTEADFVVGDDDGVVFLPTARLEEIVEAAEAVRDTERSQAALLVGGESIRDQLGFTDYLVRRAQDPTYTFRQHLAARGGAIEA